MNFTVVNKHICVEAIRITGVSLSSIFLIGDTQSIALGSVVDTPPESLFLGPFVPIAPVAT
ncbi:MAG: spore gernimation protein GerPD [Bacillaceae bacterium]